MFNFVNIILILIVPLMVILILKIVRSQMIFPWPVIVITLVALWPVGVAMIYQKLKYNRKGGHTLIKIKSSDLCSTCREIRWTNKSLGKGNTVGQVLDNESGGPMATHIYWAAEGVLLAGGRKFDTCNCRLMLKRAQ